MHFTRLLPPHAPDDLVHSEPNAMKPRHPFAILLVLLLLAVGCDPSHADWEKAYAANTLPAYQHFLATHGASGHAEDCRARILDLHWRTAHTADHVAGYEAFLGNYPAGPRADEARARLDELAFAEAKRLDTPAGHAAYLARFPSGAFVQAATEAHERLLFAQARESATTAAFESVIKAHPSGTLTEACRREIAALQALAEARTKGTVEASSAVLARFAGSAAASAAQADLDRILIEQVLANHAEFADLSRPLTEIMREADQASGPREFAGLEGEACLHVLAARAAAQPTPAFSLSQLRPLGDAWVIDRVQLGHRFQAQATAKTSGVSAKNSVGPGSASLGEGSGSVRGLGSGDGVTLSASWSRYPPDGRLASVRMFLFGRGAYTTAATVAEMGTSFRGQLAVTETAQGLVLATALPHDFLAIEMGGGLFGNEAPRRPELAFPLGGGSIYCVRGEVRRLVPGVTIATEPSEALWFVLLPEHGLTWIAGRGRVTRAGQTIELPLR